MTQAVYHIYDQSNTYMGQFVATPSQMSALLVDRGWKEGLAPTEAESIQRQRGLMVVSRFQARAALEAAGILSDVEAAVSNAGGFAQKAWEEAVEFRRNSPTINTLKNVEALSLTDEQIDNLFLVAAQIQA